MNKSIQIRVNKIESYRDMNGTLGKKIDLVEEHEDHEGVIQPAGAEEAMIAGMMITLQKTMPMVMMQKPVFPKMILFLTEEEYDSLGVTLDVNQTYQVTFENQAIKFVRLQASFYQEEPKH